MERKHSLRIEVAQNGYLVTEDFSRQVGMVAHGTPFVFETFDALTKHLDQALQVPLEHRNAPKAG